MQKTKNSSVVVSLCCRKFGNSTRLSELEKKEIQELLVSHQTTISKSFADQRQKMKEELERLKVEKEEKTRLTAVVHKELIQFVCEHNEQLESYAHDSETTSDILRRNMELPAHLADDVILRLQEDVNDFLQNMSMCVNLRASLCYETEKCRSLLKAPPSDKRSLDVILRQQVALTDMATISHDDRDELIQDLRSDVEQLEDNVEDLKQMICDSRQQLQDAHQQIEDLSQYM